MQQSLTKNASDQCIFFFYFSYLLIYLSTLLFKKIVALASPYKTLNKSKVWSGGGGDDDIVRA